MEIYEPENLKLWQMPDYYAGTVWQATYVFLGQDRDSDALTRSNFISALAAIGGESETVNVVRESHWFCGWVEWIAIHQDDAKALQIADEIVGALKNYPVVDDERAAGAVARRRGLDAGDDEVAADGGGFCFWFRRTRRWRRREHVLAPSVEREDGEDADEGRAYADGDRGLAAFPRVALDRAFGRRRGGEERAVEAARRPPHVAE